MEIKEMKKYKLSSQFMSVMAMSLVKCLAEEVDIVEIMEQFDVEIDEDGKLFILNPPIVKFENKEKDIVE